MLMRGFGVYRDSGMAKSRKAPAAGEYSLALKRREASLDFKGDREEKNKAHGGRFRSPRLSRKSGPGTPVPCWKLYENRSYDAFARGSGKSNDSKVNASSNSNSGKRRNSSNTDSCVVVSARKLAASVWALQQPQDSRRKSASASISSTIHRLKKQGCSDLQDFEPLDAYAESSYLYKLALMRSTNHGALRKKNGLIPLSTAVLSNKCYQQVDPVKQATVISNPELEKATKWDSGVRKTSEDVFRAYHQIKDLEDQQTTSESLVLALQNELAKTRLQVQELERAERSSRKEVDCFLKKIAEERARWQNKEQERIRVMIQKMKEELNNERKANRKMEVLNGKLTKELAETKMTIMRSLEDLEKERKARQLMEDVCDELAREIGEDKSEVEQLKRECMKVREEVEEERKMLQMAEVWREERVQMKLVDAKLALQEKSLALDKLRGDLEGFINSRMASQGNGIVHDAAADVRDAKLLREAACSIQVQDMKEFSYQPPTSEDVFSAFGDLQQYTGQNDSSDGRTGWDPEDGCYSPRSHSSKILTVTPETHGFNRNLIRGHQDKKGRGGDRQTHSQDDGVKRREDGDEEETEWDYASSGDEEGSSNSFQESKTSLNGGEMDGSFSESETDWEENKDSAVVITEIEAYSPKAGQLRTKGHLWGPNAGKGELYKTISMENNFNTKSMVTMTSPGQQSVNGVVSPSNGGTWSSSDAGNPHIARGIKGCVEWPKGIQKNSLKARLLEAKMESQKSQLRHVLKQKH
ncbi:uncharacterized protein LOC131039216 [Cryptomeria japonica]|uniref:uncharacterized protein LOC131039216 n=1 Tax=Cryptomeria japonica TaxID=3369 RepID=UPI0027D9E7A9|nr:uncharacterized protein LOC131039216 [Cryptomeria japonica]